MKLQLRKKQAQEKRHQLKGANTRKSAWFAMIVLALSPLTGQAQTTPPVDGQGLNPVMTFHGESLPLETLARNQTPLAPGRGQILNKNLDPLYEEPQPSQGSQSLEQPFVQTSTVEPLAAIAGVNFEGPGTGLAGFTLTGAPPDMTLAVGPNHIVAWVNSQFAVFDKSGTVVQSPVNGNSLFSGLGNVCESSNRGDPILQYDRLADRWLLSQFAFADNGSSPTAPYYQCFAMSTSNDPTGTYYRYSVQFSSTSPGGLNDYGKLAVWPDGYYTSYNMFGGSPAGGNTGVALCASDRTKMLAGDPAASTLCSPINYYGGGSSFLPADLDGTTPPSDLSQGGIFLRLSTAPALRFLKLKPDFSNGTVTLTDGFGGPEGSFINLPLPATIRACNGSGGACVAQPGTSTQLDTLGSRLMYRLAYRNRDGIESMVVTHTVDPDGSGSRSAALRWYEIRNPLGDPSDPDVANHPVIFQNGTYDPGSSGDRWMGSIAMDRYGNMLIGYSVANAGTGLKPSIALAGRELSDPLNTLQAEIIAVTGNGSQTGSLTRWGDYSTMQVDPVDDATFWYISEYLNSDGTFNWRTRIMSYRFPTPPATLSIDDVSIVEGNNGSSNAQFTITRSHTMDNVSVQVSTANYNAIAGSDYTGLSNHTVNFTAGGSATAIVSVQISGDTVLEPDELFEVTLSNATGASISHGFGIGTIENDDSASVSINDINLAEGNNGTTNFVFDVTLNNAVQDSFTLPFSTGDVTAQQSSDYLSNNQTLNFTGNAGETQTVSVSVLGDTMVETNESFTVNLGAPSNPAVAVGDGSGSGTINNDDSSSITINDVNLVEGNSGLSNFNFSVSLSNGVQDGFSLPFSTSDGSAKLQDDYTVESGTLNFTGAPGEIQVISIPVVGDLVPETDEDFFVNLDTPSVPDVSVSSGQGTGLISNDDFFADIVVSVSNGVDHIVTGQSVVYTVEISNPSTLIDVAALSIEQSNSAGFSGMSWTCSSSGTATCPASGNGLISQTLALPRNSGLSFLVTAVVEATPPAVVETTVTATVGLPQVDPDTSNNSATDSDIAVTEEVYEDGFEELQ